MAVQNPRLNFSDPVIQQSTPELNKIGIPRARTGAFATVYRMETSNGDFAIRCFLKHFEDQQDRYSAISSQLLKANLRFTVGFTFQEKGILVNGTWFPILKMDWVKGEPLNKYIERNLHNQKRLTDLAQQLVVMMHDLHHNQIAHGDLQNGNILVASDHLVLVDYDGMYVPSLAGKQSHESGHRNFQHPLRSERDYGPAIDNFSAWVIYTSLLALSLDPGLWTASGAAQSEDQLLFRREDFANPNASSTFKLLSKHSNPSVQALSTYLRSIMFFDVDQVPSLDDNGTGALPSVTPVPSSKPSWMQNQPGVATAATAVQAAPQTSTAASPVSSWIFESIAASEPICVRQFAASRLVPRIAVAGTVVVLVLSIFFGCANPSIIMITASAVTFALAMNLFVLIVYYEADPSVREARELLLDKKRHEHNLNDIEKEIKLAESKKGETKKQHLKGIHALNNQRNRIQAKEQSEIDGETNRLTKVFTAISNHRNKLVSDEAQEQSNLMRTPAGSRLTHVKLALQTMATSETNELNSLLSNLQQQHIDSYLRGCTLDQASIPGIGPKMKARLAAAGFRTAADIKRWAVQSVNGIGQSKAADLDAWRHWCETQARRNMPTVAPASAVTSIRSKYASQRGGLEAEQRNLQSQLDVSQNAIRDKYTAERAKLATEQSTAQRNSDMAVTAIRQRFASEYPKVEGQIADAEAVLIKDVAGIDETIKEIQKQLFSANLNLAKSQHKLTPYRHLTFPKFIRSVFTNIAA